MMMRKKGQQVRAYTGNKNCDKWRGTRRGENESNYGGNGRQCTALVLGVGMCYPNQSWFGLKNALIQRFQLILMGDPFESLLAFKQEINFASD
ncbi:hypothetical protein ACSQ67_024468 [Phaseolus vulgaris]